MSDQETHIATKNGQEYEVIVVGEHKNSHGKGIADENSSQVRWRYECFDCGATVVGSTAEEARSKLRNKSCD